MAFPAGRAKGEQDEDTESHEPEALLERIIRASSREGDTVLDPFAGTFTTAAVAKTLGRKSVSIETQDEYLKIGLRRVLGMKEYSGEKLEAVRKTRMEVIRNE